MKVALVHELLTMRGGAERVLRTFAEMYPQAPIYTLLYDKAKLGDWFPSERVRTSRLQRFARFSKNHHLYLPWFPGAVEAWDFSEFDVVLSSSSAFVHGIITNGQPRHLSYIHSPARYLWDRTHEVLANAKRGPLGILRSAYLSRTFHRLRTWDAEAADRADRLLVPSQTVQRRCELYWRRESTVIPPPIDDAWLQLDLEPKSRAERTYFLVASTLVPYKRIEIAIEACNRLKAPLKIAGEGPDMQRLKKLAGPTVTFLGFQSEEKLRTLYRDAKATLFPGDEDFGLVPLESLACGTPVIAYASGGALETLTENETAIFFREPTAQSLAKAMEQMERSTFESDVCRRSARNHSKAKFEQEIREAVATLSSHA